MEFRNLTPFPAIAFDGLDQHDQRFHSMVIRLTFALRDDGALAFAPVQTPLATSDEFYGEINRSSVKQESDLAPDKPHTDVIVIADACAPQGLASKRFLVALKIGGAPPGRRRNHHAVQPVSGGRRDGARPYPIIGDLGNSVEVARTVRFNGDPVFLLSDSVVATVTGNEAGTGGGMKSGVNLGKVRATRGATSVRVEKKYVVRHGDECDMNLAS